MYLLPAETLTRQQAKAALRAAAYRQAAGRVRFVSETWPDFHFASAEDALEAVNEIVKRARKDKVA